MFKWFISNPTMQCFSSLSVTQLCNISLVRQWPNYAVFCWFMSNPTMQCFTDSSVTHLCNVSLVHNTGMKGHIVESQRGLELRWASALSLSVCLSLSIYIYSWDRVCYFWWKEKKEEQVKYGVGLVLLMLSNFVDIDEDDHAGTGLWKQWWYLVNWFMTGR